MSVRSIRGVRSVGRVSGRLEQARHPSLEKPPKDSRKTPERPQPRKVVAIKRIVILNLYSVALYTLLLYTLLLYMFCSMGSVLCCRSPLKFEL